MKTYEEIVVGYRKKREREMIQNSSFNHAGIVVENILIAAYEDKLDLKVVSGTLDKDFYHRHAAAVGTLLEKSKVDIILLDSDGSEPDNEFLNRVKDSENGTVLVCTDEQLRKHDHFMVAGDSIYRLETNPERGTAVANFGDSFVGNWLNQEYEKLRPSSRLLSELATN